MGEWQSGGSPQEDSELLVAGSQEEQLKVCGSKLLIQSTKQSLSCLSFPKLHKNKPRLPPSSWQPAAHPAEQPCVLRLFHWAGKGEEKLSPFPGWLPLRLISLCVLPSRTLMWTGIWKACKSFISALFCSVLSMLGVLLPHCFGCATAPQTALGCFEVGGGAGPLKSHRNPCGSCRR